MIEVEVKKPDLLSVPTVHFDHVRVTITEYTENPNSCKTATIIRSVHQWRRLVNNIELKILNLHMVETPTSYLSSTASPVPPPARA